MQTSNWCLIARESGEPLRMGKQMTAEKAGALIDYANGWKSINWKYVRSEVRRLQMRIAKAVKEGKWNKVKVLEYLLTHSIHAKLLAVKRVTSNKGKDTPGVDGIRWKDVGIGRNLFEGFIYRRKMEKGDHFRSQPCMTERCRRYTNWHWRR